MSDINIGDLLGQLRREGKTSQRKLAELSGINRAYINQIEHGKVKSITLNTAIKLSKALNVSPSVFFGEAARHAKDAKTAYQYPETPEEILEKLKLAQPVTIPIYTDFPVHAGSGVEAVDYIYRTRPKPARPGIEGYIVHGKCLEPVVRDKDIIIVDREAQIDNGDIVACLIKGDIHIARLRRIAEELWLENNHGKFRFEDCQVTAPVIEVVRRLK